MLNRRKVLAVIEGAKPPSSASDEAAIRVGIQRPHELLALFSATLTTPAVEQGSTILATSLTVFKRGSKICDFRHHERRQEARTVGCG